MASTVVYVKGDPTTKTLGDCPFCHRALLTFERKKVPYTMEYIDFANKPAWLQEASGGKVPVIKEEGQSYMPDSDVIVVHLEEKYPQPSMKSSVPPEIGAKLFPAFRGSLMGPTEEQEDKKALLVSELKAVNDYLEAHKEQGPLFGGQQINATDAAVAPKLYHIIVALKHFKNWDMPPEFAAINKYMEAIKLLPEWQNTDYGELQIIKGWQRHMAHH
ncbi:Glutathione S-transferase dhar1 [Pleodorina starrii]|nr:Glutathione S-transferase dhar1 [Pleodorina starrii]